MAGVTRVVSFGMALSAKRRISPAKHAALVRARAAQPPLRGEKNGGSKLTESQVRRIRELRAAGERPSTLALRYCVNRTLIWYIVTRRIWSHV